MCFSQISAGRVAVSLPEGAGFGYMRNGQKKKDHECCAAHFFIYEHEYSCDEELEGPGHALLIWSCATGEDCRSFILQIERIS